MKFTLLGGCSYIIGNSSVKDRLILYKKLLENAKKDNFKFATTQIAELGSNFTIQNVKSNLVKITKKLVKCN